MIAPTAIEMTIAWLRKAFPIAVSDAPLERCLRITEESLELGQVHGMTREMGYALVDQVFDKEPGEALQEEGGLLVCVLAYFGAMGHDPGRAWATEFERIDNPETIEKIRAKHKLKVGTSVDPNSGGMIRRSPTEILEVKAKETRNGFTKGWWYRCLNQTATHYEVQFRDQGPGHWTLREFFDEERRREPNAAARLSGTMRLDR